MYHIISNQYNIIRCSIAALVLCLSAPAVAQYPISPVAFTQVKLSDSFWSPRLNASRDVTIPLAFSKCEETGRYTNFSNAAKHLADPTQEFPDTAWTFSFDDTDPYKTIEGASYLLQTYPNATYKGRRLDKYVDSVIAVIASGQEPDGYLYTARTKSPSKPHSWAGPKRWVKVEELSHEFYNLGHLLEAACAHYQATGKRTLLDIGIKYADCVCREIGPRQDQLQLVPGHQIAEMGLCKLYLVTGNKKYLDQAKFFLDMRGKTHRKDAYSQAHKPVIEQDEAVGHAVRAEYMYSGMADVAALTGDSAYIKAIDKIWQNIVEKKYYITGGVGARHSGEAFGSNYELPNASAYCETCAQIICALCCAGIDPDSDDPLLKQMRHQAEIAIETCDVILFFVDGKAGLTPDDENVADMLRRSGKPVMLVVNKVDNVRMMDTVYEFYNLGIGDPMAISSVNLMNFGDLLEELCRHFPEPNEEAEEDGAIRIAVAGKPNVGKSSIVNRLLGEDRVMVSDIAGTTRDAIDTRLTASDGQEFVLIDTAGIRRKRAIAYQSLERFSIVRALAAIDRCDVALLVIDATQGVTEQDSKIAGYIDEQGKAAIIVVNKWDAIEKDAGTMKEFVGKIREELKFMAYAPTLFISAKTGQRVDKLLETVRSVYAQATRRVTTGLLNDILADAQAALQPPATSGRRLRIYYATQQAVQPPTFVMFVNDQTLMHFSYERYLENHLRKAFGFEGTPIRFILREREQLRPGHNHTVVRNLQSFKLRHVRMGQIGFPDAILAMILAREIGEGHSKALARKHEFDGCPSLRIKLLPDQPGRYDQIAALAANAVGLREHGHQIPAGRTGQIAVKPAAIDAEVFRNARIHL